MCTCRKERNMLVFLSSKLYDCIRLVSMFVKLALKKAGYLGEDPVSKVNFFLSRTNNLRLSKSSARGHCHYCKKWDVHIYLWLDPD